MSVRAIKKRKKKETNGMKVLSFSEITGSVFVPFKREENWDGTERWSLESQAVPFFVSDPSQTGLYEGKKNPCCAVCTPGFYNYSERMERWMEKKRWYNMENDKKLHCMPQGLIVTQINLYSSSNKEKKTWEKQKIEGVSTGFLHWGRRNEFELKISGKLTVGRGMESPARFTSVTLAPGRRRCPWLSRVEGAFEGT